MTLESELERLIAAVPEAIGAIVCDFEGETVVVALGSASLPREAEARALEHVPRRISLEMPVAEFLMRLGGAEPCAILRIAEDAGRRRGGGGIRSLHARYRAVEVLVDPLPEGYYLVLVLRRPALASHARFRLQDASQRLSEYVR